MRPTLKAPGSERLKLKCDVLLSTSAFKFNLRPYNVVECPKEMVGRIIGRGGETIKGLQAQTGARVQIDQAWGVLTTSTRPTLNLLLSSSMLRDSV